MHVLLLALSLATSADLKVAQGSFSFVGLSDDLRSFVPEHVGQRLQRPGLKVVTTRDIQNILGLERQRELLGCNTGSSCTAELMGALGADALLVGEVAKVGPQVQVNLKIVSGTSGETIASFSRRVEGESRLLEVLDEGADALGAQLLVTRTPRRVLGAAFWIPAGLAVVGLAGSGAMLGLAAGQHAQLSQPHAEPLPYATGRALVTDGQTFQAIGFVALGVGVAAAIGAGVAFGLAPTAPVTASVSVGPGAGLLAVSGRFP